jgi:putative hydrolase of the HAD superfamily
MSRDYLKLSFLNITIRVPGKFPWQVNTFQLLSGFCGARLMTIRAVIFDMGGTLETFWFDPELRLRATPGLRKQLLAAGIDPGLTDEELFEKVNSGWEKYHKQSIKTMEELPAKEVWRKFILEGLPVDENKLDAAAESLMTYLEWHYYSREMRPEVPAVLQSLKATGMKIGLISNVCSRDQVPQSLKDYGIFDYFNPIVLSSMYRRRKPDPAIFHYAARLINEPTSACLYVGDRIARDIVGARRAGYGYAVQIVNQFDHGERDKGAHPDAVIHRMTELLDFINRISETSPPENKSNKRIKALLFDAGDILYFRPKRGHHLCSFLQELGLADKKLSVASTSWLRDQAYHGLISQEKYREEVLRLYGVTDAILLERGQKAMDLDDNNIQVIKGVPETLKKLKQKGYLLAIVTDTAMPLHTKLAWFEQGGFGGVWDAVISSKEIGTQKPAPLIFNTALEQLGVSVEQAAFIGHSPEELDGARALGMKTIAFNCEDSIPADYYLKDFEDLLKVPPLSLYENEIMSVVK